MIIEKDQEKTAIAAAIAFLAVAIAFYLFGGAAVGVPMWLLYQTGNLLLVSAAVALLSAAHAWLARTADEEERHQEQFAADSNQLFDNTVDAAGRNRVALRQFHRVVLPVILVSISCGEAALAVWVARHASNETPTIMAAGEPLTWASLYFATFLVCFVFGKYCAGAAFGNNRMFLRPVCNVALLNALVCFTGGFAALAWYWTLPFYAAAVTKLFCGAAILLAAERVVTWVIDLYRPRKATAVPVYESRFLTLFSQPHGVLNNVTELVEYQFGITLSEGGIASLLRRVVVPFGILQVFTLACLSCITYIQPHENGVLERWGERSLRILPPGLHITAPWPAATVQRVTTSRLGHITIQSGSPPETITGEAPVLWQNKQFETNLFLTGGQRESDSDAASATAAVHLAAATLTIQFLVADPERFQTANATVVGFLTHICEREFSQFLLTNDFAALRRQDRRQLDGILRTTIQAAADQEELGVSIVCATVESLRPPPQVAPIYQAVIDAQERQRRKHAAAETFAVQARAEAEQRANRIVRQAEIETAYIVRMAEVETQNFEKQLQVFNTYPELYKVRTAMDSLETWLRDVRKIVATTENAHEVINLELKESGPDLLSLPLQ